MTTPSTLVETALGRAESILLGNAGQMGLLGAQRAYQQVWARDSMICSLGLLHLRDPEGAAIARRSLETLRRFQSPLGNIPHNVGGEPPSADTAHAGCVDSALWYVLGHYFYQVAQDDRDYLREAWPSLERAVLWLRYQDSNECGLLEVHEAMDWADLFANRYNVLYDNVLWAAALRAMAHLADRLGQDGRAHAYDEMAVDVRRKVNLLLWVGPEEPKDFAWLEAHRKEWLYPLRLIETALVQRPYYLPYVAFRDYVDRCDVLGNLLAVLCGVADDVRTARILDYVHAAGLDEPFPVRALHPVIHPGEKDWRDYYLLRNLNQPYQYHNGGIWPFIGGFYVAALVKAGRQEEAVSQLRRLAELNRRGREGEWEFNEWFHGQSGRPMGFPHQSWSAAMFIFACWCVQNGRTPFFEGLWGKQ